MLMLLQAVTRRTSRRRESGVVFMAKPANQLTIISHGGCTPSRLLTQTPAHEVDWYIAAELSAAVKGWMADDLAH